MRLPAEWKELPVARHPHTVSEGQEGAQEQGGTVISGHITWAL